MTRRAILYGLTFLLGALTIGSVLYVPPEARNVLKPIPAHAQLIYSSARPDLSLPFFQEPSGAVDLESIGVFRTIEKNPLAVATVPLGGRSRRDAWVVVSALGPQALTLRWKLALAPPTGVRSIPSYSGWPIWELDDPGFPLWMTVRFALTEGLLICSISDDSHDIYSLLNTLDGRAPALAEQRKHR